MNLIILFALFIISCGSSANADDHAPICCLRQDVREELNSYQPAIEQILSTALSGRFENITYNELSRFVDDFGPRFDGTQTLEDAIDYAMSLSRNYSLENVHGEQAKITHWVRGKESATLLLPRKKDLAMLGLGYSVGTSEEGITAEAIVVKTFEELQQRASEVPGKIVVYNEDWNGTYGRTVVYRSKGATEASKLGAVAVLIRSVTPFSLYTPHTGMMGYTGNVTKIPAACITVEDAQLLHRLVKRGKKIKINIKMEAKQYPDVNSQNVIAEIKGSSTPEKLVVVSGHIDSWDVGQGAIDDAGGAFISWGALALLKSLKLRPKRTIRLIMWTGEEVGIMGARQYIQQHKSEEPNLQLVMESDIGTFAPLGLEVTANTEVQCILQSILEMLRPLGNLKLRIPQQAPDIEEWVNDNVPGASLYNKNEKYFWYHHTNADTMETEDPISLNKNTALFAAVAYVVADLSLDFPRNDQTSVSPIAFNLDEKYNTLSL